MYRVKDIVDDDNPTIAVAAYSYNKAGEPTQLALKNGTRTAYTYDEVGRLESLINYDPDDWVISSCGYVRNDVGCPTRITYQDGRRRDYGYDDLYRLTSEEHSDAQANSLLWHNYIYDEAGNRLKKLYDSDNEQTADRYTYVYDALNQISTLTATGTPGDRIDVAGTVSDDNLSSVTVYNADDPGAEFEAQLRQQLFIARAVELEEGDNDLYALALDKASNEKRYPENDTEYHTVTLDSSVDLDHVYNDRGCLTEIVEGAATLVEYVYDYENRLIKVVEDPNGTPVTLAEYQYDGLGRRVWSNVGGVETRFIYSGNDVLQEYEYDSGWVLAAEYVHGVGVDQPLRLERDGSKYYYHYDGYGSVTELTDSSGALSQAYEYDAWGNPTIYDPTHASQNPYLYTGRRWDASISLYYYRARHYAPDLGRFLQPDPAGYADGPNLYAYALSSPTIFVDPTGMTSDDTRVVGPGIEPIEVDFDDGDDWSELGGDRIGSFHNGVFETYPGWEYIDHVVSIAGPFPTSRWTRGGWKSDEHFVEEGKLDKRTRWLLENGFIEPPRYKDGGVGQGVRPGDYVWDPVTGGYVQSLPPDLVEVYEFMQQPVLQRELQKLSQTEIGYVALTALDFTAAGDIVATFGGFDMNGNEVSSTQRALSAASLAGMGFTKLAKAGKAIGVASDVKRARKAQKAMRVQRNVDKARDVQRARRAFKETIENITKHPEDWRLVSAHAERAVSRRARGGASIQRVYKNERTGKQIYRHTVVDGSGKVLDDHYRPFFKGP